MARTLTTYGKTTERKTYLKKVIEDAGFEYTDKNPDILISYGGDGTYLRAERLYPGIPKVLFKHSKICNKCHTHPIDHALNLLKTKKYTIKKQIKLEATKGKTTLLATNDIVIRNAEPQHAIRFTLNKSTEYIGDGIVVATPFGSTGYYHSITKKTFDKGIGIAFNNSVKNHAPLKLSKTLTFTLTRGKAQLVADNNPKVIMLKKGDTVTIKQSKKKAKIVVF